MSYTQKTRLYQIQNYKPKRSVSPSTLVKGSKCLRAVGFDKIQGIRQSGKSLGALLGDLIHACVEMHLTGQPRGIYGDLMAHIDPKSDTARALAELAPEKRQALIDKAPQRALAGLNFIPPAMKPGDRLVELRGVKLVLEHLGETVEMPMRFDVLDVGTAGNARVIDHKSTVGGQEKGKPFDPWLWALDENTLKTDIQAICYAAWVFAKCPQITVVELCWIYYLTAEDKAPLAKRVQTPIWRYEIQKLVEEYVAPDAFEIARAISSGADPNTLWHSDLPPSEDSFCSAMGWGCPYRSDRGGPCDAIKQDFGSLMLAAR